MFGPFGKRALSPPRAGQRGMDSQRQIEAEAQAILSYRHSMQQQSSSAADKPKRGTNLFSFPMTVPFTPTPKKQATSAATPEGAVGTDLTAQLQDVDMEEGTPHGELVQARVHDPRPSWAVKDLAARADLERRLKEIKSLLCVQRQVIQEAVQRSERLEDEREAIQLQLERLGVAPAAGEPYRPHAGYCNPPHADTRRAEISTRPRSPTAPVTDRTHEVSAAQLRSHSPLDADLSHVGIEVSELPPGIPIRGVGVARVADGCPAQRAGIKEGDIITDIGGVPVPSLDAYRTLATDPDFVATYLSAEETVPFNVITEMANGPGLLSRVALVSLTHDEDLSYNGDPAYEQRASFSLESFTKDDHSDFSGRGKAVGQRSSIARASGTRTPETLLTRESGFRQAPGHALAVQEMGQVPALQLSSQEAPQTDVSVPIDSSQQFMQSTMPQPFDSHPQNHMSAHTPPSAHSHPSPQHGPLSHVSGRFHLSPAAGTPQPPPPPPQSPSFDINRPSPPDVARQGMWVHSQLAVAPRTQSTRPLQQMQLPPLSPRSSVPLAAAKSQTAPAPQLMASAGPATAPRSSPQPRPRPEQYNPIQNALSSPRSAGKAQRTDYRIL